VKKGKFVVGDLRIHQKNSSAIGVVKKIHEQTAVLNNAKDMSCELVSLPYTNWQYIFTYSKYFRDERNIDFIYIRRFIVSQTILFLLKNIRNNNPACKILYEIPTYPYDKEHVTIRAKFSLFIDKIYRNKLKQYVDRIVTMSEDDSIFGIPTIKIINGINCSNIPIQVPQKKEKDIHLIAVANFTKWHGYDRLIEGLNNYYKEKPSCKIYVHFVGDGGELNIYKQMVLQYNLSDYVVFYGLLSGEKLSEVYNKADVALASFGCHRIGVFLGSFLKTREYLARGIPMVSSTKIDVLPKEFRYCLYVPEDESPIDISRIIAFYQDLLKQQSVSEIIHEIRAFAEEHCDMSKTMKPVIAYIKE
jgi:glycosyltransferase involved in cell wall biosynthesis